MCIKTENLNCRRLMPQHFEQKWFKAFSLSWLPCIYICVCICMYIYYIHTYIYTFFYIHQIHSVKDLGICVIEKIVVGENQWKQCYFVCMFCKIDEDNCLEIQ